MKRSISFLAVFFALVALVAGGFGAYVWHWEHRPHVLEIYCFALDPSGSSPGNLAVFIRTPNGHSVLIDGGKTGSVVAELSSVMPFYRRSIDTLILTNPDDSHVTGLADVIGRYHVGQVVEMAPSDRTGTTAAVAGTSTSTTSSAYTAFENEVLQQKIPEHKVSAGDEIDFGDPVISVNVLFPTVSAVSTGSSDNVPTFQFSKTNSPVLVFAIYYGASHILFGGDISKKEQAYLGQTYFSQQIVQIAQSSSSVYSTVSADYKNMLLILPHGENVGVADESFFTELSPENIVVLKKPDRASAGSKKKPITDTKTTSTSATSTKPAKQKKSAKAPFAITPIFGLTIINLAEEGDMEFISDGAGFSEKKLD